MDFSAFQAFHSAADSAGLVYYYSGHFDEEVRRSLSTSLKSRLEQEDVGGPAKRKLFSTFMEMAQNVLHYGGCVEADGNSESRPGAIAVGREGDSYWIICGNLVPHEQVARITAKLEQLKQMTLEEIKQAYREQLANDDHAVNDTISKGAGLGLLTIARDSAHPIEYAFTGDEEAPERFARFHIKAFV
ncbi:hypothetical protein FAZ69_21385 [Trinickia terrae]|uniref:Uncharacterized protein n=2 Tax=Trinickia terrae TaxID=2571161 RepID=A0A4U1HWH8_9BURK|nr:hypothetical protein FAZ69_21385 [Trinickia terrae]